MGGAWEQARFVLKHITPILVPNPYPSFCLQEAERWAGPGNKATVLPVYTTSLFEL